MSFDSLEKSRQDSRKAELYEFKITNNLGLVRPTDDITPIPVDSIPPSPGGQVVPYFDPLVTVTGPTIVGPNVVEGPDCDGPFPGLSYKCIDPIKGTGWIAGTYTGGIGGGGDQYYMTVTVPLGAGSGLTPGKTYIARVWAWVSRHNTFEVHGIKIESEYSVIPADEFHTVGTDYVLFALDLEVKAGAADIQIKWGHFDIEILYANIVGYEGIAIYDPELPPSGPPAPPNFGMSQFYTSAEQDITFQGVLYEKANIKRSQFQSAATDATQAEVEIEVNRDHPIVDWFKNDLPLAPAQVIIRRVHRDDLTVSSLPFKGQVTRGRFQDPDTFVIVAVPMRAKTTRRAPRMLIQRPCNHMLYDRRCKVNPDDFDYVSGTVLSITGRRVEVSGALAFGGLDISYFRDGVLIGPNGQRGYIESVDGNTMILLTRMPLLLVNDVVTLLAGCQRTIEVCHNRFDNRRNFGGFPGLPVRTPFNNGAGLAEFDSGTGDE